LSFADFSLSSLLTVFGSSLFRLIVLGAPSSFRFDASDFSPFAPSALLPAGLTVRWSLSFAGSLFPDSPGDGSGVGIEGAGIGVSFCFVVAVAAGGAGVGI
jgi:hypothetical protein